MKKNPTVKWGIAITLLYCFIIGNIINDDEILGDEFVVISLIFIICPTLIAYLYDVKVNHPKYNAYIKKIRETTLKEKRETRENTEKYIKKYDLRNKERLVQLKVIDSSQFEYDISLKNILLTAFKEDNCLYIVSATYEDDFGKIQIPLKDIKNFNRLGDMISYTKTSGGGGGGSSIGKAIIGGVIAGEAGAIIGSRNKVKEVKTEHIVEDKRQTILEFVYNNKVQHLFFRSIDYDNLLKLIPDKEISYIKTNSLNKDIYENIKNLAKLKDEGILAKEEFENKKQELLDRL